jgi:MoaA/NifB/PqqE/SkfB family radical SAM enzyme
MKMNKQYPTAPEAVFFSMTDECPMRCNVCSMWAQKDPSDAMTKEDRLATIDQLPEFGRPIHVIATGGEPFLRLDQLLAMSRKLKAQGNTMGVVTSGYFLTPTVIENLVGSGITHLAVSLDFPTKEQHDTQRGRPGTFLRILDAINRMNELRRSGAEVPSIGINTILMAQNLNYIEDLANLAKDLQVKEILFQPIQPDFGLSDSVAYVKFRNWLPMTPSLVDKALDELERKRKDIPLGQSPKEFDIIRAYFRSPLKLKPGTCIGPSLNLMIDVRGNVTHCFGQSRTRLKPLGKVPGANIVDIWNSERAIDGRNQLSKCSLGCSALLCHCRSSVPNG